MKISLSRFMYKQYKEIVIGNEDTSHKQANLKMRRNAQLAATSVRPDGSIHYKYGCLHFIVANNKVVWMSNNMKPEDGWKRDNRLYLKLSKELGIEEDVTMLDLVVRDVRCNMKYKLTKMRWKLKLKMKQVVDGI